MSRPPFGPRIQPHMHAPLGARACSRWRRAASLRHAPTSLALIAATLTRVAPLGAQQAVPPTPAPQIAPYKLPTIALVQPPSGGTVPQDKPVVVFRFAQGEPADPIDVRSFTVMVDGEDRTRLFQLALLAAAAPALPGGEAWGPLDDRTVAEGSHEVSARICSSRGACGVASAAVLVADGSKGSNAGNEPPKRQRVLRALLDATRRLLLP